MAGSFDAALKHLLETDPAAWLRCAGLPATIARVIDADLSTIGVAADKVVRVTEPESYLAHLEFQAGDDRSLPERTLLYNVLLRYRHKLPVRSVVFLLRREADSSVMTGLLQYREAAQAGLEFRYEIVRVWELPVEDALEGGLGVLPLAPLMAVPQETLPSVMQRIAARIEGEASAAEANELWTGVYVLLGLKFSKEFAGQLLRGVQTMKESTTYQAILQEGEAKGRAEGEAKGRAEGEAKGRAEGERNVILRQGTRRFGAPTEAQRAALEAITEIERLEQLAEHLLEVESWEELLA